MKRSMGHDLEGFVREGFRRGGVWVLVPPCCGGSPSSSPAGDSAFLGEIGVMFSVNASGFSIPSRLAADTTSVSTRLDCKPAN